MAIPEPCMPLETRVKSSVFQELKIVSEPKKVLFFEYTLIPLNVFEFISFVRALSLFFD